MSGLTARRVLLPELSPVAAPRAIRKFHSTNSNARRPHKVTRTLVCSSSYVGTRLIAGAGDRKCAGMDATLDKQGCRRMPSAVMRFVNSGCNIDC